MRAVVCVLCVLTLTALCRRHFRAIAQPSSVEQRSMLRGTLRAFGPAIGDPGICAAFGTQLVLQPGSCDSASYNRMDPASRSYQPDDANVEVSVMVVLCCVYMYVSPSPSAPQVTSTCANYLLGNTPPDMQQNLKM